MPKKIIKPLLKPFEEFFKYESSSGILLLVSALVALFLANSPWAHQYEELLHFEITLGMGQLALSNSLVHWINDGLMAVFFFLVGMEIKREVVVGELKEIRNAILPIGAALGGMMVPALIYLLFNQGTSSQAGWGVPMATDIAFALGALSLLGNEKAPKGLAVFITALAIIDDLGAILVIAFFYTETISWTPLLGAVLILAALLLANKLKKQSIPLSLLLGFFLWLAFLKSGIHSTLAGVILGLTISTEPKKENTKAMVDILEHSFHPWVAFGIMPIFALANAGVSIDLGSIGELITQPVSLGIILGLFLGKQMGIFGAAYLMIRLGFAKLPELVTLKHIYGASLLSGIGFTMSLFIATLAFQDENLLNLAKFSIIIVSAIAGASGLTVLGLNKTRKNI